MFGPDDSNGEESFGLLVCNALYVQQKAMDGPFSGRHHLIVSEFDVSVVRQFLLRAADHCSGGTWDQVAEKLARIGHWEFEDYSE